MTEEVKKSEVPAEEPKKEESEPQYTPKELEAMAMGWRPKDQWEGNEEEFVEAKEFVARKSLFDKIEGQTRKIRDLERTMWDFKSHYEKVRQTEFARAMQELKAAKRAALEEEDTKTALQIEEDMEAAQMQFHQEQQEELARAQQRPNQPSAVYLDWVKDNTWYGTNTTMHRVADGFAMAYMQEHPGAPEGDILNHVSKEIRRRFPENFGGSKQARPAAVDGGGVSRGGKPSSVKLPPEDLAIMNRLVKAGVLTEEQYIKDWKAVNQGE